MSYFAPSSYTLQSVKDTPTFCTTCAKTGCGFSCGNCKKGEKHFCRKCNTYAKHRSSCCNGKIGLCLLECDLCVAGADHMCRNCGALNHHRTRDCTVKCVKSCPKCIHEVSTISTKLVVSPYSAFSPTKSTIVVSSGGGGSVPKVPRSQPKMLDPRLITQGSSIIYEKFYYNGQCYYAVHGDKVGRYATKTMGLAMGAGGGINRGSDAHEAALAESKEEHGCSRAADITYIDSDSTGRFHTFLRKTSPWDYDQKAITTPEEIIMDPNYVPNIFGRQNCIQTGQGDSTNPIWFVKVSALFAKPECCYTPFLQGLKRLPK